MTGLQRLRSWEGLLLAILVVIVALNVANSPYYLGVGNIVNLFQLSIEKIVVALMMTLIDQLSELTTAYLLVIGVVLIVLVLWFPKGILGTIRERWLPWLM